MSQPTGLPGGRRVQPIQSLNPYMGASWTIRARVASKGQMRTYNSAKGDGNLFNVEFIDEDGTRIEATLWREVASKYFEVLEEGKVFYISKAGLKPANKVYSSVNNDYQLLISDRTAIEECKDSSAEQLQNVKAKLQVTKIADLPQSLGSRMLLDVVGIIANAGPLGSVKRKADNSELTRRDLTIFDSSGSSVSVTLWQSLATEEGAELDKIQSEHPIIALQGVRANDYNGVSLSTVSRSSITVNPSEEDIPEVKALKEWFATQDGKTDFPHCGAGLMNNGRASLNGGSSNKRVTLKELKDKPVPPVGSKAEYFNVLAYIGNIMPDQTMYYMSAPDGSNRKVIPSGSTYFSEATQKHYDSFVRRYVMRGQIMDHTGQIMVNVFNDQAEVILGCTADELAELKEKSEPDLQKRYDNILRYAAFKPYNLRVMCKVEEYQDVPRLKFAVQNLKPLHFVEQSAWLLENIQGLLSD